MNVRQFERKYVCKNTQARNVSLFSYKIKESKL
jgi:hypothetical protein